jgi:hypothetical protein
VKIEDALKMENVKPTDFNGKTLKEFIFISEKGFDTEEKLQYFVELGIEHASSNN